MTPIVGLMPARIGPGLRAALCLGLLGLLAACGTGYHNAAYDTHRRGDYAPPGPPEDPWGPYIREASQKYRVPEQWVRAVMRQESGGREYLNGHPITSNAGAMGLMQVMPSTYASLADRYGLGGDPYEPHDNIMAGTAYIREMYEQFGSPGFLAAYNAGPGPAQQPSRDRQAAAERDRAIRRRDRAAIGRRRGAERRIRRLCRGRPCGHAPPGSPPA